MEEGILFFWASWLLWIIVTFLMKKSSRRTILAYWILLTIISSSLYFHIGPFMFSLAIFTLFIGSIILMSKQTKTFYHLLSAFTITICYSALLLWEKISPIWVILPREILISIIISCFVYVLCHNFVGRISICLFGMLTGEMIYSFILSSYGFQEVVGEKAFLDTLICTLLILSVLDILHKGKVKVTTLITKLLTKLEVAK
ncbi:hypothetical protein NSA56_08075 [Oceanobacillus caeni]|uniref:YphA family membrane protein n=1 Tax=Oceanobacillus caeni TaxID=405946 RepID=UPI001C231B3A|nr:hypothetical protein [Oceanobacillus caeni]MBU8789741.1 hypothetical protein [Oceanobacillus caeni]MCR1834356.1 hypothetical protein [Oceanobacillus caeni]